MTFEEYCDREYKQLRDYLQAFPENEIKEFWNSQIDYIKKAYKNGERVAFCLSLMF